MSQATEEKSERSAVTRAEERLDNIGQRIGLLAGRASQRIKGAVGSIGKGNHRKEQPKPVQKEEQGEAVTKQAEEIVDRMGQRMRHFSSLIGQRILGVTARVREGTEDMWAEAQNIRHTRGRNTQ
jgi:tetrahydromethanopterin S-methyltransferase subunit G